MSQLKRGILTKPFNVYKAYSLWEQVAIDSIGPLPESKHCHKYIIVIIDTFSRFVNLIPVKDLEGITAAEAIIAHIGAYGAPCSILTDNGTQYVNKWVDQLLDIIKIDTKSVFVCLGDDHVIIGQFNNAAFVGGTDIAPPNVQDMQVRESFVHLPIGWLQE
jgi:hypothetical protein